MKSSMRMSAWPLLPGVISKKMLRDQMRQTLVLLPEAQRREKSVAIQERLFALEDFVRARCVAFYIAVPPEVETSLMIDRALATGKKVVVPSCNLETIELSLYQIRNRERLQRGAFGILEPVRDDRFLTRAEEVDCVIVPGVVFDKKNNRLGRGGGYYDRFLKQLRPDACKVGLAFSFQIVDAVPTDPHDVPVDIVLTD